MIRRRRKFCQTGEKFKYPRWLSNRSIASCPHVESGVEEYSWPRGRLAKPTRFRTAAVGCAHLRYGRKWWEVEFTHP
jgi:hypothetical protein